MRELSLLENKVIQSHPVLAGTAPSINWQNSFPVQRLLDVISSILAEEYIMIAKQNPEVFIKQGKTK